MSSIINENEMKAILQGMIFVSETPVTLRQMLTKVNSVYKKQQSEFSEDVQTESDHKDVGAVETFSQFVATTEDAEEVETQVFGQSDLPVTLAMIKSWLNDLQDVYQAESHGFELVSVANGYQFRTKIDVAQVLHSDKKSMPSRLSASALETLAIVAYEQPVARSKVDDVRGVDSGGVLKTLLDKEFLRIVGRADEAGQPLLYGTTPKFLEVFNLQSLKDMPSLNEIKDLYLKAEDEESDGTAKYFDPEEVLEQRANAMTEEELELMSELDESLESLKEVEHSINMFNSPKVDDVGGVVIDETEH